MTARSDLVDLAGGALLANYLRNLAQRFRDSHPDRGPDFADGVEWAAVQLDLEAEQ